jgi:hypothetical protein
MTPHAAMFRRLVLLSVAVAVLAAIAIAHRRHSPPHVMVAGECPALQAGDASTDCELAVPVAGRTTIYVAVIPDTGTRKPGC